VKLKVVSQRFFFCETVFVFFFFNITLVLTGITHATQKSLDYFISRFWSFYQINATKEKIIYYTRLIKLV
jgi:hypothetical protein